MCIAVANYIIEQTNEYNENSSNRVYMSGKRLQKLIFFCDVEYMLSHNGTPLVTDEYYAWPSGPVIPEIYNLFVQYQSGQMYPLNGDYPELEEEKKKLIEGVLKKSFSIKTDELIKITHYEGTPWHSVYHKDDLVYKIISKKDIYSYYSKQGSPLDNSYNTLLGERHG